MIYVHQNPLDVKRQPSFKPTLAHSQKVICFPIKGQFFILPDFLYAFIVDWLGN
jgi:hypothetical protein